MDATSTTRSTRDRPAKAPLSGEAVIDAALEILRSDGLDAVTMRRVASALDTGAASLYVYVANREALLLAMQDRITETIELERVDPVNWRAQLHRLLERMLRALVEHPGIAAASIAEPPTGEASLRLLENLLGVLLAGGLEPQDAAWAADILALLVTYAAIEEETRGRDVQLVAAEVGATFAALPTDRFPLITTYAAQLVSGTSESRFQFAVDVVIDGILVRAERR